MTEMQLRQKYVNTAASYHGYNEKTGGHKQIIDIYNRNLPLPRGYKVKYTDEWCATFVSAMAIKAGLSDIIPLECGCGQMIQLFKAKNAWVESDAYIPMPGDIIFYDWQDSGSGENTGWPDHVGIVAKVSGSTIQVIEGNMTSAVGYRRIHVNAKYIRGYGVPKYGSKATGNPVENQKLKVGSVVKIKQTAPKYATGQPIPSWVKTKKYTISQLKDDRVLLKEIVSWVNISDIEL